MLADRFFHPLQLEDMPDKIHSSDRNIVRSRIVDLMLISPEQIQKQVRMLGRGACYTVALCAGLLIRRLLKLVPICFAAQRSHKHYRSRRFSVEMARFDISVGVEVSDGELPRHKRCAADGTLNISTVGFFAALQFIR